MNEPTALIDTASEFTEDAWVTPEDDQMWPEDWQDYEDERMIDYYAESSLMETDIAWDCDGVW